MGLSGALSRLAVRHAHVLLVEVPGHWLTRVAVERQVLDRGLRLALSPADADVLAVCGPPGPELAELVDRLWDELPGPRARMAIDSPEAVSAALAAAEAALLDTARQRADSRDRKATPGHGGMTHGGHRGDEHADHGGMDHGEHPGMEHAGHDAMEQAGHAEVGHDQHGGMTHGGMGHAGMDHGGMEMAPAGIPLAEGGEDRDGLEMDVLHVRLGPVLPYWPAGLVLRCALLGDVITDAESRVIDAGHDREPAGEHGHAARRCDNAAKLLALAGWEDAAARARRIRDALLRGDTTAATAELDRLRRTVRRSWLLRWSLRRVGPLTGPHLMHRGLPDRLGGDARDRLLAMLDTAADSIGGRAAPEPPHAVPVEAVADLVRGWDLATARLIVASLDLEPWPADREVSHV